MARTVVVDVDDFMDVLLLHFPQGGNSNVEG
jgi:hypothetical protein